MNVPREVEVGDSESKKLQKYNYNYISFILKTFDDLLKITKYNLETI